MNPAPLDSNEHRLLFWRLQFLGWGCAVLPTIGIGGFIYSPVRDAIILGVFRSVFGLIATSFLLRPVLRLGRRSGRFPSAELAIMTILLCGLLGFVDTAFTTRLAHLLNLDLDQPAVRPFLAASAVIRGVLYGFWSVLYFSIRYWLETRQHELRIAHAETAARSSELQALRAQVNPHFLFNALNSILAESGNPGSVRRITLALADYLRFSLQQHKETESLGAELQALENYLRIEKFRFENNFDYRIETDTLARQAQAPVALIQPLVENAIKYGQRSSIRPLRVTVTATVQDDMLEATVTNSGEWVEEQTSTKTGIANLRRRLELLYGDRASLSLNASHGEVRACVRLPVRAGHAQR